MTRFIASDPRNRTLGASIMGVTNAMGEDVAAILQKHGLAKLTPDKWYPQQDYLNVYNDIFEQRVNVMHNLVAIGMKTVDEAVFPPDIQTLQDALMAMDVYYHLNNEDKDGGWQVELHQNQAICTSTTPFPTDFEYGILYALVRRFQPENHTFIVKYDGERPEKTGPDNPCRYIVTWKPR